MRLTFSSPEGFETDPADRPLRVQAHSPRPDETMVVSLDKMGGTVDRRRYKAEELTPTKFSFPPDARMSLEEVPWRSFTLDAFRVEPPTEDQHLVVFVAPVPLAPEAIELTVIASPAHEAEARGVFRSLIASVDGKSNWLSDSERDYKLGLIGGTALPFVGVAIGLGIHFARQRRFSAVMIDKIRVALADVDSLALPELVTRVGLRDGFLGRGKLMNVIHPMVASGELLQEEPPGTTMRTRLGVLRFRLRAKPST